jgi:hypothetical protein
MEREETKVKGLSEIRFSKIIFLLRVAGIPFKMKKMSTVYAIYMITAVICTFITFIGMFVDLYVHRDDLRQLMTKMRVFIGMWNIGWVFFCFR